MTFLSPGVIVSVMGKWLMVISLALASAGCSSALEDGYKPRLLGASDEQRRGYYATPFTPQAEAASQAPQQEFDARRPHPGY
jgi:hypothetical protein